MLLQYTTKAAFLGSPSFLFYRSGPLHQMDMLPSIIERVTTSLLHGQNQFASGGLLLMVIGGIAAYARNIPTRLWDWFERQFTLHLTITDECDAFYWFKWWFKKQEYCGRNRNMDTFTSYNAKPPYVLTPAPGRHWFFYNKRPIFVHFDRTEEKKGGDSYARRTEKYTIWTFGRKQAFMRGLLDDMVAAHTAAWADKPTLMLWGGSGWFSAPAYTSRTLDSVILPGNQKEALLRDILRFKVSKAWYELMGIPFHRGYLFYGAAGDG